MSLITLRAYLAAQLPEPGLDEARLTAFFEQEDVASYLAQIEQLTGQIVARWPQKPVAYHFLEPVAADESESSGPIVTVLPETLPPTGVKPPEPVFLAPPVASAPANSVGEDTVTTFSFLASEAEVEEAIQSNHSVDEPAPVTSYDIAPTPVSIPVPSAADPTTPPLTPTQSIIDDGNPSDPPPPAVEIVEPVLSPPAAEVIPIAPTTDVAPQLTPDAVRFAPTNRPEQPAPIRSLSIPNATVGKPYAYRFDFGALGLPEPSEHTLVIDAATGLNYDHHAQIVSGTPLESGEFTFDLTYRTKTDADRPAQIRRIQLLVNPDPRSLWKDLPSDTTDEYYKPDSAQELLAVGNVRLLAASVRGRSHAHEGKFRDDDFRLSHLPETGWYLLTVADGAGSARYSRRGAQLACQTVTDYLQRSIDPPGWTALDTAIGQYQSDPQEGAVGVHRQFYDVLGKAVFDAYKAIEAEALTKAAEVKDYATTLISVLAKPVAGRWFVGAFWIGDGGVGVYSTHREPVILGTPDGGEYAGQTRFLTMSETIANNFFGRFQFTLVDDFTAVVLMTDGVTDPKFQTDGNLSRQAKWDELWADLSEGVSFADDELAPTQLQDWLTFWSPGNHDDRTIALLYTHGGNAKN